MYLPDPTYLSTSRLGVYYFRFPIPITFHPEGKASDLKLSLRTKNKRLALCLSNALRLVSENILEQPEVQQLDYQTIRSHVQSHFKSRLSAFRDAVMTGGPIGDERKAGLSALIVAAKSDRATFINHTYIDDQRRLVAEFCEQQSIPDKFSKNETDVLLTAYQAANLQLAEAALAFNAEQAQFDLLGAPQSHTETHTVASAVLGRSVVPDGVDQAHAASGDSLSGVAEQHLKEGMRGDLWVAKTLSEKREALTLLSELLEGRTIQSITKPDARLVKDKISRLPKNRSKSPLTKDLSLDAMLQLKGIKTVAVRTLNGYMSHFQTFFKWAVEQGYAQDNVFEGMRFKASKRSKVAAKDAFNKEQLREIFRQLTENPDGLVKKETHKWVSLIAMFTGARLNEVAQLDGSDLQMHEGVWCFSFATDGGDPNKRLKTEASRRLVPVHDVLIEQGVQEFCEAAAKRVTRLFPDLSYDAQNGYGRNVGRWMNESLLVKLDIKTPTLTFHSLRHSFNTQLAQKDTPEHLQKAILGHTQSGMSYNVYFREGFLPDQLKPEVNKFSL
jgi:integrase